MELQKMSAHTVIIPCYNEALRLRIDDMREFLELHPEVQFCFVNDGSTDKTLNILKMIKDIFPEQVYIVHFQLNKGKAEAIRQGILYMFREMKASQIGFLDADLSTELEEYYQLSDLITSTDAAMVFGSRGTSGSPQIHYSPLRFMTSKIARLFIHQIIRLPIKDTQCGAKVFSNDVIEVCFDRPFITRWLSDVEIFLRLKKHFGKDSMKNIKEVYLRKWVFRSSSKIKLAEFFKIPYQFFQIILHY